MHYIEKRLNQLTSLGFRTFTNRFELNGAEITFNQLHTDSDEEWEKNVQSALAKAELKTLIESEVAYSDYQDTTLHFIKENKVKLLVLLNSL